jgi:hypothetical protein
MMRGNRFSYPCRQVKKQVSCLNLTPSDCINDYGFRVITLKSLLSAVHGLLSEASAARIFDSLSLSRSVPALKRSRYAGTHDRCTSDSHGRDFERTSQRSTCTAQTLLSAQFWRAQPQILGRKSRIRKSHSHTCQLANPTAPVRASMKSARAWQVRIRASLHPENARGEEQENAKSARDRQKRGRF